MSDEKETQPPPPVYPIPVPAPVSAPVPAYPVNAVPAYPVNAPVPAYPVKDETPSSQKTTVPPPPVPVPVAPLSSAQYQEQLFASCAGGHHDPTTKFGTCGIITAICCFPIGLLCLCADKETRCARCGVLLR